MADVTTKGWSTNLLRLGRKFPASWENLRQTICKERSGQRTLTKENEKDFGDGSLEYEKASDETRNESRRNSRQRWTKLRPVKISTILKKYRKNADSLEYNLDNEVNNFQLGRWNSDFALNRNFDKLALSPNLLEYKTDMSDVHAYGHSMTLKPALKQRKDSDCVRNAKRVRFSIYALLLSAASENAVEELKEMIQAYPSHVNRRSLSGDTALHRAANRGHLDCVKLLVEHGANVQIENTRGQTPLSLAWKHDYDECLNFMLKASAG